MHQERYLSKEVTHLIAGSVLLEPSGRIALARCVNPLGRAVLLVSAKVCVSHVLIAMSLYNQMVLVGQGALLVRRRLPDFPKSAWLARLTAKSVQMEWAAPSAMMGIIRIIATTASSAFLGVLPA